MSADSEPLVLEAVEATRHFMPRKSTGSWTIAALLGLCALALLPAFIGAVRGPAAGPVAAIGALLLATLAGTVFFVRRARDRGPVLSLTAQGVVSRQLPAAVAWESIDDVVLDRLVGSGTLHLQLRGAGTARIGVALLSARDQEAALGAIHARLAPLRAGAGQGEAPSLERVREAGAFAARLQALTPVPWALYAVMGLNAALWLAGLGAGWNALRPAPAQLFAWGANSASAVVVDGQWWRLLTSAFLHAGLLHLALNMLGLWGAGRQVCRWLGNGPFLLVYLGAALAGSALSLHAGAQHTISVGASGAVFGVLGALLVVVWRNRARLPLVLTRNLLLSQGLFVLYMLAQGFGRQGIDNAAHLGGLLAGAAMAALLVVQTDTGASRNQRRARLALAAGLAAALVVVLVATTPRPTVNHRVGFARQAALERALPKMRAAEVALQRDTQAHKAGTLSLVQFVDSMAQRHIPAYRAAGELLAAIQLPPNDPAAPAIADALQSVRLLTEMMELEVRRSRGASDRADIERQLALLSTEYKDVVARIQARTAAQKAASTPR